MNQPSGERPDPAAVIAKAWLDGPVSSVIDAHDAAIEDAHAILAKLYDAGFIVIERERFQALDRENVELRAGINGSDWENDLLAYAPDDFDDDVAQSEIVTRYIRWLEQQVKEWKRLAENPAPGYYLISESDRERLIEAVKQRFNKFGDWDPRGEAATDAVAAVFEALGSGS